MGTTATHLSPPLLLSTWSWGVPANEAAWPILEDGGSCIDAVEAAGRNAELDPANQTVGRGGLPDSSGRVSLDAAIMVSPARRGGVACVRETLHAITAARRVMESTPHALLAGEDADDFARHHGIPRESLLTSAALASYEKWLAEHPGAGVHKPMRPQANFEELYPGQDKAGVGASQSNPELRRHNRYHDTISIIAADRTGAFAAGSTTSGLAYKIPGRVGDSPIIGHGVYCDPAVGAAVATGHGELVMGICGSFLAVETLRRGGTPADAAEEVLKRIQSSYDIHDEDQIGVIVMDSKFNWSAGALRSGFRVAVRNETQNELVDAPIVLIQEK